MTAQQWGWSRGSPIPQDGIRLLEAFELFYQKVTVNWRELDDAVDAADKARGRKFTEKTDKPVFAAIQSRLDAREKTAEQFMAVLEAGKVRALMRDPNLGSILELPRDSWKKNDDSAHIATLELDAVDYNGRWCPVFFERDAFEGWLKKMLVEARRTAKVDCVTRCVEWLVKLRENGPQRLQKAQYKDEARETFGVGPDQFRTAWKTAAARVPNTDWGVPGAPKIIRRK